MNKMPGANRSRGFTLIEVLITVVILAIGLLGLAGLQITSLNNQLEAYQRAQALLLLNDMGGRIRGNATNARVNKAYADATDYGLRAIADCSLIVVASPDDAVTRDICEWNNALAGTGAKLGSNNLGSAVGARACIENLTGSGGSLTGSAAFKDREAIVRLTIAWLGTAATQAPASTCGQGAFGADDAFRRTATLDVNLGNLANAL